MTARPVTRVAILSLPESGTMAAFGLHEVLGAAGDPAGHASGALEVTLIARETRPFTASTGLSVTPQRGLTAPLADVLIVCDIHLSPDDAPQGRWRHEIAWVRRHLQGGALVCSTCSGAVLLAEAGLLEGNEVASHWSMAELFRDRYPGVRFRPERILCDSGHGGRLITTGGASAWQDLALYLIGRFCGAREAARIARLFLLGDRGFGQLPFASMARPRQHSDAVVSRVQAWLVDHYATPHPVSAMVEQSGLPERSLKRRFKLATGYTPVDYVQTLRIEEAKQMLETDGASIDGIAAEVGYEDPGFFRKLFKRRVGVTPAQYRQRTRIRGLTP
jgi:transcriptional regulator GlxA family with amidase domain